MDHKRYIIRTPHAADMIEIRFHGRGGQGAVTAGEILADAAFREGKWSQKIPVYGGERRGAPVMAFTRIDDKKITLNCGIEQPNCIIVLDQVLPTIVNVSRGLREGGIAVLNDLVFVVERDNGRVSECRFGRDRCIVH